MCAVGLAGSDLHVALSVRESELGKAGDVCAHVAPRTCCASSCWWSSTVVAWTQMGGTQSRRRHKTLCIVTELTDQHGA